jgi:tetratricopeptide (TPR) repeat protein
MSTGQQSETESLTLFERHVKQALRLYSDPKRLGEESPLASHYMLGRALRDLPPPITATARGGVLRSVIHSAAHRLWRGPLPKNREAMLEAIAEARRDPDDPRYAFVVLELRCFQTFIEPYRTSDIWEQPHLLPGSKSQHYRDFDQAVKRLSVLLLDDLRPALRSERPRPPEHMVGYGEPLQSLVKALHAGQTVALSGPGGVGKSSLAAAALDQPGQRAIFWYTLRPGFNDGVSSLLVALGAFLHEQGAPHLWPYLAAANGAVGDLNLAAALLRQDLATLAERPPILCFDDLEHLSTGGLAPPTPAHIQLLDLIEGLHGSTPLLLISQRPVAVSDVQLELSGLAIDDLRALWAAAGHLLEQAEAERIHAYTGGNPRLLTLLLALWQNNDEAPSLLEQSETTRPLLPAFQRLWRRLSAAERSALQQLSVYQAYAPEDVIAPEVLATLASLRLVERDGLGGISMLPALAPIVRDDLTPEMRERLHRAAAVVRLERGEHTAAAYHFAQGGQADLAVQVWFPQRQQALVRGEADAARAIFSTLPAQHLSKAEHKALTMIRAELHQLAGETEAGLHELTQQDPGDESEASARLWMLRGELEEALGYPDKALASYGEGVAMTARLLGQLTALHQRRGRLLRRGRQLQASWAQIHRGEYELAILRGLLREEEGAYDDALAAYTEAQALADQLDDDNLRAQAERQLAAVYGRRQQLEQAVAHATAAIVIYQRTGDRVNLEKMRSNLAFIYVQTRQFEAALEVGAQAYSFFQTVGDPHFATGTGANLAEASYELGRYDEAVCYADNVLAIGDRFTAPYARFTLGQVALARKQTALAAEHFSQSMELARQNEDLYLVAYAERALGEVRLAEGALPQAHSHLSNALAIFRQLAIPGEIAASEQLLEQIKSQL